MKKIIAILFIFLVIITVAYFGYRSIKKHRITQQAEQSLQELPVCSFYTLNEKSFTYNNQKKEQTLIVYFHPECEHCQYEAKQILENKTLFENTQILMISPAPLTQIKQFVVDYQLATITSLKVLWDKERKFENYFGKSIFPTLFIYNQENKLQSKYNGEVEIEAILNHLGKQQNKNNKNIEKVSFNHSSSTHFIDINITVYLLERAL